MVTLNGEKLADFGVYINLDYRTDRKGSIERELLDFNINGVNRFAGLTDTVADCGPCNLLNTTFKIYEEFLNTGLESLLVLEDDCKFLEPLNTLSSEILTNIYSTDWDLFWLGCVNRKKPKFIKNKCYQVSSVCYAQSYIIKRNMVKGFLRDVPRNFYIHGIDELLNLYTYSMDLVKNPFLEGFNFYNQDNPLDVYSTNFKALCYELPFSTQYNFYSDNWKYTTNLQNWIPLHHPRTKQW